MGLLGVSVIVASVVLLYLRPPAWLKQLSWPKPPSLNLPPDDEKRKEESNEESNEEEKRPEGGQAVAGSIAGASPGETTPSPAPAPASAPAPAPAPAPPPALHIEPDSPRSGDSTPKAPPTSRDGSVPTFSLSTDDDPIPPPTASSRSMAPPPLPPPRIPTLNSLPSKNSLSPAPSRGSLLPNRAPGTSTLPLPASSLAPPPTHNAKPSKPSRTVLLTPGHSPLDWARLSSHPGADLRGLGPGAPPSLLRVPPSLLRLHNGRRGRDAWTVLGGRVYNLTPYLPFHPGGEPELLRGAGRDGTRLFGEVHPWVNYEGMLAACLVGISVSEEEAEGSKMEEMD